MNDAFHRKAPYIYINLSRSSDTYIVSLKGVIIGSGNGLFLSQAIMGTDTDLLPIIP